MIVTLTLNPAVDQTLWVDRLRTGEVNRPSATQLDPAGKGINAARVAHRLGGEVVLAHCPDQVLRLLAARDYDRLFSFR